MSMSRKLLYWIVGFCFAGAGILFLGNLSCIRREEPLGSWLDILPIYRYFKKSDRTSAEDAAIYEKILKTNQDYLQKQTEAENKAAEIQEQESGKRGMEKKQWPEVAEAVAIAHPVLDLSMESLQDYNYLLSQFYIVDPETAVTPQLLDAAEFLTTDLTISREGEEPQILIYHTHAHEGFVDSDLSDPEQRIIGVGSYLKEILEERYGYRVLHIKEEFDFIDGVIDRSAAYEAAESYIGQVLEEHPSIQVVIDLHRDGVPEERHLVTEINGKPTARIMNFNGLSYLAEAGPIEYLPNSNLQENLAFSFQLLYQAALYYPELYRGNYLSAYRYNLQLSPRAMLLEAGAQTNTLQEVKNAMEPFADILNRVLCGEETVIQ